MSPLLPYSIIYHAAFKSKQAKPRGTVEAFCCDKMLALSWTDIHRAESDCYVMGEYFLPANSTTMDKVF